MPPPSLWSRIRHTLGRALRETGQALDRVGIRGTTHARSRREFGDDPYFFNDHLSRHRARMPLIKRGAPIVDPDVAFVAPCSTMIGSVRVGPGSSVWYGAVLRADKCTNGLGPGHGGEGEERWKKMTKEKRASADSMLDAIGGGGGIYIGSNTNIQDGSIVTAAEDHAMVGDGVTVGHLAQIHSAAVEDHSLVGMGSVLSPGSKVESQAFVAAGAVVGRGETVGTGELWVGNPAKKLRDLTKEEKEKLFYQADEYVKVAKGQSHVMELGGNIPDTLIEHTLLGDGNLEESAPVQETLQTAQKKENPDEEHHNPTEKVIRQ